MININRYTLRYLLLKIDVILSRTESAMVVIILGSMIAIAFLQVILRNFFSSGIIWGDTLLRHLVLWIGFLGASLATRENRHLHIDALSRLLNKVWKQRVLRMTNLFSACVCALLVKASFVFIGDEYAAGTSLFLGIPSWLFMCVILFGFSTISLRFLLRTFSPFYQLEQPVKRGD